MPRVAYSKEEKERIRTALVQAGLAAWQSRGCATPRWNRSTGMWAFPARSSTCFFRQGRSGSGVAVFAAAPDSGLCPAADG